MKNMQKEYLKKYRFATTKGQIKILKVQNFSKPLYDVQIVVSHLFQQKR